MAQGKKKPTPSLAESKVLKDVGEQLTKELRAITSLHRTATAAQ